MEAQQDFKELLELLNKHEVEYVVVGGHALAFHGAPRYTGDIDILVHPTEKNARKIMAVLRDFGFGEVGLSADDFVKEDRVVQLGRPPVRVDLLTSVSGVTWPEVDSGAVPGEYAGAPVRYIGRAEFVRNKRALGRNKDLADIEALGEE